MIKYDFIKDIIDDNIPIRISVQDFDGNEIGYLKPITKKLVENDLDIAAKLTEWRNKTSKHFLTTFVATEERTKNWLLNQVLTKSDKLLFLIYSDSDLVGHLGFANYTGLTAELDNLIRGEVGGHSELILFSEFVLIDWMFTQLNISVITAQVLYRNIIAMLLHKKVGFNIDSKIYLKEIVSGNESKLIEAPEDEINNKVFTYIISLQKDKFYETFSRSRDGISDFKR